MEAEGTSMPAETQPLPSADEHTDEDTLVPRFATITRGKAHPKIGMGDRKVVCSVSMSDAVLADRR